MQLYTKILIGMGIGVVLGFLVGPNSFLLPAGGIELSHPDIEGIEELSADNALVFTEPHGRGEPMARAHGVRRMKVLSAEPSADPDAPQWLKVEWTLSAGDVIRLQAAGLDVFVLSTASLGLKDLGDLDKLTWFRRSQVSLTFVITAANAGQVGQVVDLAAERRLGLLLQPAWIPAGHPAAQELDLAQLKPAAWLRLRAALRRWGKESGCPGYARAIWDAFHGGTKTPVRCGLGSEAFVLDADGQVGPCFHRRDLSCGNALRQGWDEILGELARQAAALASAPCFGVHCLPLHVGSLS